jgi:hypothetical protein
MYTCNHCKKKLKNEPYMCSNNKKYCSYECVPASTIDKPYSYQYFSLMDGIRDIEVDIENIKTLYDRIELENKIEELSISYTLETYGDDEGLFYKRQIGLLLETLNELYDKVHNIFMETKYDSMPFVIINWEDLKRIIGEANAKLIFDIFKDELDKFIFDNVYFTWSDYKCKTIDFSYESKLKFATMHDAKIVGELYRDSFKDCNNECILDLTNEQLEELNTYTDCIDIFTLYRCVVCEGWEQWECFTFYDKLKLYKCDEHCGCDEYDHHYQDED